MALFLCPQFMAGRAWGIFGCAGFLRFLVLHTRVRLATLHVQVMVASLQPNEGAFTMKQFTRRIRARAWRRRAIEALRSNSSLRCRLARYNAAMARARSLEAREVQP